MPTEVQEIAAQFGGERALGRSFRTDGDIDAAIREGFPQKVVAEIMHSADITLKELAASLDLSARSLQRRRREGRLAKYESDRIYRLARVIALAKRYIGDDEKARHWLKRPNRALGGRAPLELIDTEPGVRAVEYRSQHRGCLREAFPGGSRPTGTDGQRNRGQPLVRAKGNRVHARASRTDS